MVKTDRFLAPVAWTTLLLLLSLNVVSGKEPIPGEQPLWAEGKLGDEISYADAEEISERDLWNKQSPSGSNRVFSRVSKPTYTIHKPEKPNGVALVICPGGGYSDVWLDREGHDLAIWLEKFGITSLVLKYRTNNKPFEDAVYIPAVTSDARQAIRILRENAVALAIDPKKIGISGFSAGGNLALGVLFRNGAEDETRPNFAGLFYPWFRQDDFTAAIENSAATIPPLFIMNAADDTVTPTARCLEFYAKILKANVPKTELHIYNQGSHGFDLGDGKGESTATWKDSFVKWMNDVGLIPKG